MKELLQAPDTIELEMLFLKAINRPLRTGDQRQDIVWENFISALLNKDEDIKLIDRKNLLKLIVENSVNSKKIQDILAHISLRNFPFDSTDLEESIIRAGSAFHIRYTESEYRLGLDSVLAAKIFDQADRKITNYDIYGPGGVARVRFSPEFQQVRINVKAPISEESDGKRTRLKFEYRGETSGNKDFVDRLKIIAVSFLKETGDPFSIKQGVEVIKRDPVNLPIWINRQLILDSQFSSVFKDKSIKNEEKIELLNSILKSPEKYTHHGNMYWLEVDAENINELNVILVNYISRSDSDLKRKLFSTLSVMK